MVRATHVISRNNLIGLVFALQFQLILGSNVEQKQEDQVVVRAVFINCESNRQDQGGYPDNEATRFQREELYKHGALQGCRKKLALTLRLVSEPEKNSGDEYIPIEHVFDGPNKKRVRLLNPYILRLRRESPVQAYKLRRIDSVVGVITRAKERPFSKNKKIRVQRNSDDLDANDYVVINELNRTLLAVPNTKGYYDSRQQCPLDSPVWRRDKRHEHNIIIEDNIGEDKMLWLGKDRYYQNEDQNNMGENEKPAVPHEVTPNINYLPKASQNVSKENHATTGNEKTNKGQRPFKAQKDQKQGNRIEKDGRFASSDLTEKKFAMYTIGKPELWYTVHAQLFEKMSTYEGKTVWNDITKGEVASVTSIEPEWVSQDMNVKYRPTEWMSKDQFSLPDTDNLCLLVPSSAENSYNSLNKDVDQMEKYIVVPKDDIISIEENTKVQHAGDGNYSDFSTEWSRDDRVYRRVLVRVSRALLSGSVEELKISSHGPDRFLVMPHQNPHSAQIDLEARADQNELVRVGSSGSLITIVADNTRRTRSTITAIAMNNGLASARFKVKTRDCGPELAGMIDTTDEALVDGPVQIAPRHTHYFRLQLPIEIPMDVARCSIELINDDQESVAVREVAIKKGDRCFCVWHCECVCLDDDPKLQCREMTKSRQATAGLSPKERARRARSACYPDVLTINLFVVAVGVIIALLIIGLVKAMAGLFCRCVATWGLDYIIQTPRKLDQYYEFNLKNLCVVYDEEGWPVHPDTKQRTVRLVSREMEFALNVILFITAPCMILWDAMKHIFCRATVNAPVLKRTVDAKKCFSTHEHDMQGRQQRVRRRCGDALRRWMTPDAEEVTTDIWRKGLPAQPSLQCEFMRPLLHEQRLRTGEMVSSGVDSEQDDTVFVLTEMRKSKESLAISQRNMMDLESSPKR